MNPNITVAADLAALDKNVTESLEDGEAAVQKTQEGQAAIHADLKEVQALLRMIVPSVTGFQTYP